MPGGQPRHACMCLDDDERCDGGSNRYRRRRGTAPADRPGGARRAVAGRVVLGGLRARGHPPRPGDGGRGRPEIRAADNDRDRRSARRTRRLLPPGHRGVPRRRWRLRGGQAAPRDRGEPAGRRVAVRGLHPQRGCRRLSRDRGGDLGLPGPVRRAGLAVPGGAGPDHRGQLLGGGGVGPALHRPDRPVHCGDRRGHHRRAGPVPPGCRPSAQSAQHGRDRWA